jgi:hypothetical protein
MQNTRLTLALLAVVALVGATACKDDKTTAPNPETYTAALSGANETSPPALVLGASGTSVITVSGNTLTYSLTTAGFSAGTTAPAGGTTLPAHIHLGAVGVSGGIMVPLTATVNGTTTGSVVVVDSVLTHMRAGNAYVNVHTNNRSAGEIRGQLARQP